MTTPDKKLDIVVFTENHVRGDMEFPYTARIKGIDIERSGDSKEEALKAVIEQINDYIKCARKVKQVIHSTIGPL